MSEELKPCPICKIDEYVYVTPSGIYADKFVCSCNVCGASTGDCLTEEEAEQKWNTLVEGLKPEKPQITFDELRQIIASKREVTYMPDILQRIEDAYVGKLDCSGCDHAKLAPTSYCLTCQKYHDWFIGCKDEVYKLMPELINAAREGKVIELAL